MKRDAPARTVSQSLRKKAGRLWVLTCPLLAVLVGAAWADAPGEDPEWGVPLELGEFEWTRSAGAPLVRR